VNTLTTSARKFAENSSQMAEEELPPTIFPMALLAAWIDPIVSAKIAIDYPKLCKVLDDWGPRERLRVCYEANLDKILAGDGLFAGPS
jgi:hypothetical protein